jgi:hypothetical protein
MATALLLGSCSLPILSLLFRILKACVSFACTHNVHRVSCLATFGSWDGTTWSGLGLVWMEN